LQVLLCGGEAAAAEAKGRRAVGRGLSDEVDSAADGV